MIRTYKPPSGDIINLDSTAGKEFIKAYCVLCDLCAFAWNAKVPFRASEKLLAYAPIYQPR